MANHTRYTLLSFSALLAAGAAHAGCADSIRPADFGITEDAPPSDAGTLVPTGPVTTGRNADGTFTTIVDATAAPAWTYLDFGTRAQASEAGPWDLRYQRFHISANGGVTGAGGVEVAPVAAGSLAEVTAVPAAGWITDAPDGDDANLEPDYAFEQGNGWYAYDIQTHVLKPRPLVWVVRTRGGAAIKLSIERYYDAVGTPGWITFRWGTL
jgi:hypothetical protein